MLRADYLNQLHVPTGSKSWSPNLLQPFGACKGMALRLLYLMFFSIRSVLLVLDVRVEITFFLYTY
jgi:hypothetical protein